MEARGAHPPSLDFELAVDTLLCGDVEKLPSLLKGDPSLVHPALPGQNVLYADLGEKFKAKIAALPIAQRARATFRVCPGQESLPRGVLQELEVEWNVLPNNGLQTTCEDTRDRHQPSRDT